MYICIYIYTYIERYESLTLGLGPLSGVSIGYLSGAGALWDCVPRVCGGGGGCAGGGVPLGAVSALSWCAEVSLGGIHIIIDATHVSRCMRSMSPTPSHS